MEKEDFAKAMQDFQHALELDPRLEEARTKTAGNSEEGHRASRQAPLSTKPSTG